MTYLLNSCLGGSLETIVPLKLKRYVSQYGKHTTLSRRSSMLTRFSVVESILVLSTTLNSEESTMYTVECDNDRGDFLIHETNRVSDTKRIIAIVGMEFYPLQVLILTPEERTIECVQILVDALEIIGLPRPLSMKVVKEKRLPTPWEENQAKMN
jgi:hypothetical protein